MEKQLGELTEEELQNALSGIKYEQATEKALEHPNIYRKKMIDELKKEKEILIQAAQNTQSTKKNI